MSKKPLQMDILIIKKLKDILIRKIDPQELTLTFVCSRYPRNLLQHLKMCVGFVLNIREAGFITRKVTQFLCSS